MQQGYKLQNLMCLVNKETLIRQHEKQQPNKASGIYKVTKDEYSINLEARIDDLLDRMKKFSYKPLPVRRAYIEKANGKLRPLRIPAYEDKLVQGTMADVLNEIYENCHQAIREINQILMTKKVNYVLGHQRVL